MERSWECDPTVIPGEGRIHGHGQDKGMDLRHLLKSLAPQCGGEQVRSTEVEASRGNVDLVEAGGSFSDRVCKTVVEAN